MHALDSSTATPTSEAAHAASEDQNEHDADSAEHADHASPDQSDASDQSETDEPADAASGAEGATGKRKRRRRRKRKDGAGPAIAGEAGAGGESGEARPDHAGQKKKESHAPFAHRFTGAAANKRHAFAVGEVVAGRVQKVDYGVIVVDLFGKAIAMADEYEPREIPVLPEPPATAALEAGEAGVSGEGAEPASTAGETPSQDVNGHASETTGATESASAYAEGVPAHAGLAAQDAHDEPTATFATPGDVHQPVVENGVDHAGVTDAVHAEVAAANEALLHAEAADHDDASVTSSGDVHAVAEDDDHDDDHDHDAVVSSIEPEREKPAAPALGQVFKGRVGAVSESGHIALLNRLIDSRAVRDQLSQFREQHKRVHGMVYGYNRGGFDVLVEGLRAFCPASAMSLEDIIEPLDFVGKKLEFLLPASKAGSKDIIVSRRSILERLQRRKTKEFLRGLTPGQRFKGKVTAVRDFGLFVDIGGIEGLVHQSELSYAFGVKPSSVAKAGDEIDVQVLRVGGDAKKDKESGKRDRLTRVSLSVKALLPDPWETHAASLSEGSVHKGKVVRAAEFGAFIEIAPEVEGLLHITELGRDLKHASQAVREGEEIYVAVERVDRRARRVSLSKLSPAEVQEFEAGGSLPRDDAATRNLRQGNNVKVKIERIEPRCVFGRVAGTVGRRGRAFIPNSETGTERGTDLRKRFPVGSEIEAKIIGIDRDGSLKCSVKAMQIDEERQAVKNYRREAAKQGFGTFGDLLRAKLGEAQK